jgi:hypothetical protein
MTPFLPSGTPFLPSVRELGSPLLGEGISLAVTVESARSLCPMRARPQSTCRVPDCHSVENLGFQILDRINGALLQGGTVGSAGPLCTLGKQAFWCHLQSSRLQLSSLQWGIWHSHSSRGEQVVSHYQAQWGIGSLCAS